MPHSAQTEESRHITFEEWKADLDSIELKDQVGWIRKTLKSKKMLHIFGRFFMPHIIQGSEPVPECHLDLIEELNRRENGAIIFPRSNAKSTWEKIDTIHDIEYALELVILYVGATLTDAKFHFESIKSELENNELLRWVYGDLVPAEGKIGRKWTNVHLETTNDVNLVARGAGKGRGVNIKNQRPTKIILDDIEEDEQIRSPERCMQLHDWLYNVIFPSLDPRRGFIKMVGTVLATHAEILKFYKRHGGIFRRAIEDGESIWPWMWSLEKLEEFRKTIGSRAFEREMMNNPIDLESAIIKPDWVKTTVWDQLKNKSDMHLVMMMDPQAGESKTADYYGIVIVGYYVDDIHRYVMARYMGRKSKLEQAALFVQIWQKNPRQFRLCGIEVIMTQVAVYQLVLAWKAGTIDLPGVDNEGRRDIPLTDVSPRIKGEGKMMDKQARLEIHEPAFERGEIHFHQSMVDFMDRLTAFPRLEHDDDIDALIYALDWSYGGVRFTNSMKDAKTNTQSNVATMGNIESEMF